LKGLHSAGARTQGERLWNICSTGAGSLRRSPGRGKHGMHSLPSQGPKQAPHQDCTVLQCCKLPGLDTAISDAMLHCCKRPRLGVAMSDAMLQCCQLPGSDAEQGLAQQCLRQQHPLHGTRICTTNNNEAHREGRTSTTNSS